jgi:hypothetical protein
VEPKELTGKDGGSPRACRTVAADGFRIEAVKQCAFVGGDQAGNVMFQVVVRVSEAAMTED